MSKRSFELPGLGLRNLKTALGVFLCILLYDFFQSPYVVFACISVIICLSNTVQSSYIMAKDRMVGTILGGIIGVPFLLLNNLVNDRISFFATNAIMIGLGIVFVIYLCNLLNTKGATSNACIVFLSVLINLQDTLQDVSPYLYSFNRMVDSAVGIIIALVINKYLFPFDETANGEQECATKQTIN